MNREQLWKLYCDRNPKFLTDGANFTAKGLKDFFDRVYALGFQGAKDSSRRESRHDLHDLFKGLFAP